MKFRLTEVKEYKTLINCIASIPSIRKQFNSIEQCIQLEVIPRNQEAESFDVLEISTVDSNSHSIKLSTEVEALEEGKQLILSSVLKTMTAKLNKNYCVLVSDVDNMLHYTAKPYGTISDYQFFKQDINLSSQFDSEIDWELEPYVIDNLEVGEEMISSIVSNTYLEREVYVTINKIEDSPNRVLIHYYVQSSETSYIKYSAKLNGRVGAVDQLSFSIRPNLLAIVGKLNYNSALRFSKEKQLVQFKSERADIVVRVDTSVNKTARKIDSILASEEKGSVTIGINTLKEALSFQSYNKKDTDIIQLSVEEVAEEEQRGNRNSLLHINADKLNKPSKLEVVGEGEFDLIHLSISHLTKAISAVESNMSSNSKKEDDGIVISIREIPVKNSTPIKAIEIRSSLADVEQGENKVVLYETRF